MPPSTPAPLSESAEFRAYPDTIPSLDPPGDWADEGDPISTRVRAMTVNALAPGKLPTFDDIDGDAIVAALLDDDYDEDRTQTGVQAFRPISSETGTEETGELIDLSEEAFDDDDDDKTVA